MSTLVVQDIVPRNFSEMSVQSRSISLSWLPPETNISVIGYTLICNDEQPPIARNVADTNTTVSGLTPFTYLSCFVYTRVEGNQGENSSTITIQTDEESKNIDCFVSTISPIAVLLVAHYYYGFVLLAVPGDEPQRIREGSSKTSEAITLTWDPPTLPYGIITTYTVSLRINGSQRVNVTDSQIYTISGLSPWELVTVNIAASNSKGMGPFSPAMDYRSAEASELLHNVHVA